MPIEVAGIWLRSRLGPLEGRPIAGTAAEELGPGVERVSGMADTGGG